MTSSPLYAPDGMAHYGMGQDGIAQATPGALQIRHAERGSDRMADDRARLDWVLPHERHDDGLVHNHGWAINSAERGRAASPSILPYTPVSAGAGRPTMGEEPRMMASETVDFVQACDRHDDGLVHNHGWAFTG